MQGSGGGQGGHDQNLSASRTNMLVPSNFPHLGIGYNNTDAHQELPSKSIPLTLERTDGSALRHNAGYMETLSAPDNGGIILVLLF